MYRMFERTNLCPYTDQCDSFLTIKRAENWMEKDLAGLMRGSARGYPLSGDYAVEALMGRLEHTRRMKERCFSHNGRCLRFWQFKAKEEGELTLHRLRTALLRHEYHGEGEIKPLHE